MCLVTVDKTPKGKDEGQGYKFFDIDNMFGGNLLTPFRSRRIPEGKWVVDGSRGMLGGSFSPAYPKGFHIYRKKIDAIKRNSSHGGVVRRVKFRRVVATGKDCLRDSGTTVVAKEIFVVPEKGREK